MTDFGDKLALYRQTLGWSFAELATRCGVSKGQLCRVEQGKSVPTLDTAAAIVKAFGMSLDVFMGHSEARHIPATIFVVFQCPHCGKRLSVKPVSDAEGGDA